MKISNLYSQCCVFLLFCIGSVLLEYIEVDGIRISREDFESAEQERARQEQISKNERIDMEEESRLREAEDPWISKKLPTRCQGKLINIRNFFTHGTAETDFETQMRILHNLEILFIRKISVNITMR